MDNRLRQYIYSQLKNIKGKRLSPGTVYDTYGNEHPCQDFNDLDDYYQEELDWVTDHKTNDLFFMNYNGEIVALSPQPRSFKTLWQQYNKDKTKSKSNYHKDLWCFHIDSDQLTEGVHYIKVHNAIIPMELVKRVLTDVFNLAPCDTHIISFL